MRKSLLDHVKGPVTSTGSSAAEGSHAHVQSAITGTRMVRCHPWRALALAQQLVHTELLLPAGAALMVMENAFRDRHKKNGSSVSPGDDQYQPGEEDIRQISQAFDLSVILIRKGKVAFDSCEQGRQDVMVLAWMEPHSWYVILSDSSRLMWDRDAAHKLHSRIHS